MYVNARVDPDGWVRCGKCGHKLFRLITENGCKKKCNTECMEQKCHSCKALNRW